MGVLCVDHVGGPGAQIGARANEKDDHGEEGLEVEKGRLHERTRHKAQTCYFKVFEKAGRLALTILIFLINY